MLESRVSAGLSCNHAGSEKARDKSPIDGRVEQDGVRRVRLARETATSLPGRGVSLLLMGDTRCERVGDGGTGEWSLPQSRAVLAHRDSLVDRSILLQLSQVTMRLSCLV